VWGHSELLLGRILPGAQLTKVVLDSLRDGGVSREIGGEERFLGGLGLSMY